MGINNILPHLPGGDRYFHSFYELDTGDRAVVLDAAGSLWQFAATHARDFLRQPRPGDGRVGTFSQLPALHLLLGLAGFHGR